MGVHPRAGGLDRSIATELVTRQVERFAPGFRDRILASTRDDRGSSARRSIPSDIGGDILGGAFTFAQAFRRPVISRTPWRTPAARRLPRVGVDAPRPRRHRHARLVRGAAGAARHGGRPPRASRTSSGRDDMDGFAAVDFEFARQVLQRGIAALYVVALPLDAEPVPPAARRARPASRAGAARVGAVLDEPGPPIAAGAPTIAVPTLFRYARTPTGGSSRCARRAWWSARRWCSASRSSVRRGCRCCASSRCGSATCRSSSIGQTFYGFGWEMLLLEAGFLAAFLGSDAQPPPTVVIVLLWWLVFRLEFGAGMIKIRGGREWRDLTALMYHHETQPMPGPLSRQAHLLPRWFHRGRGGRQPLRAAVVPWFLFAPLLGLWVPGPVPGDRRRGGRRDRHRDPAVARRHRQLRLAQLGDHRARVRRRSASRASDRLGAGDGATDAAAAGRRHPAALAHRDDRGRRALPRHQLAAAAQSVRAAPADERELQPLAARRTRTARSAPSRRSASRSSSRGRRTRIRMPRPGTSTGSRASRATSTASPASSRRTTCGWTG